MGAHVLGVSMIIRRIREHAASLEWFAVGVDLLIAITGVFIGIQVSNWNEGRSERAQSHEDRQRLIADLRQNEADYLNRQNYYRAVETHATAALKALEGPIGNDGERFLIDAYQATQIAPREAKRVTYDEILSTGRLTRLGDPLLRDRVGNFYNGMDTYGRVMADVPPFREKLREAMPGPIQVAIRARCPERYIFLSDGTSMSTLPDRCTVELQQSSIAQGVSAVRGIPDLTWELNRVIGDANIKLEITGVGLHAIRTLREQLVAADPH
jgi:hypothetical protein